MARGFRAARGGLSAPKRQIANDGFGGLVALTFGANLTAKAIGNAGFLLVVPAATLVRTRGILGVALSASGSNFNVVTGVLGIKKVAVEAFNAGLASLSTPLEDIEGMWIVWQPFTLFAPATGVGAGNFGIFQKEMIDSKGMRKLKVNDVLAVTVEARQSDATTGTVIEVGYDLRMQFKL